MHGLDIWTSFLKDKIRSNSFQVEKSRIFISEQFFYMYVRIHVKPNLNRIGSGGGKIAQELSKLDMGGIADFNVIFIFLPW